MIEQESGIATPVIMALSDTRVIVCSLAPSRADFRFLKASGDRKEMVSSHANHNMKENPLSAEQISLSVRWPPYPDCAFDGSQQSHART